MPTLKSKSADKHAGRQLKQTYRSITDASLMLKSSRAPLRLPLAPITPAFNNGAKISNWQFKREIDTQQHLRGEDVPS